MSDHLDAKLEAVRRLAQAELLERPAVRHWWVDAAMLVIINLVFGGGAMLVLTAHFETVKVMQWAGAVALGSIGLFGAVAAVRPGWRDVRLTIVALGGMSVLLVLASATGFDPGNPFLGGIGCGLSEASVSVIPVVMSMVVLTRFAPDPLRAVVAGLAAGSGGLLALHLHCPNGTLWHLVAFHVAPWVLVSLAAVLVRRLLGSSSWAP